MNMPHINLPPDLPGIRGPMAFRPETARPLNELDFYRQRAALVAANGYAASTITPSPLPSSTT
jgi:hypothetical protein